MSKSFPIGVDFIDEVMFPFKTPLENVNCNDLNSCYYSVHEYVINTRADSGREKGFGLGV